MVWGKQSRIKINGARWCPVFAGRNKHKIYTIMARSVDYLSDANKVYFIDGTWLSESEDTFLSQLNWNDFKENLISVLVDLMPSLNPCSNMDGRETVIFLENGFCQVGLSEYCGLISLSFRFHWSVDVDKEPLYLKWFKSIEPKLNQKLKECFSMLDLIARFSNGEAIYQKAS